MVGVIRSDPFRGASNLAGRSNMRTTEATKCFPRVKRIAGFSGVPSRSTRGEGLCRCRCLELIDVELPGVGEDGMPGRNGQRKPGTARGSPRRSRAAKASRISRCAAKSRCACERGGWGRLSDDGSGQNNPNPERGVRAICRNSSAEVAAILATYPSYFSRVAVELGVSPGP